MNRVQRIVLLAGCALLLGLAGPPAVHDCVNGRRTGNLNDYENFTKLAHHFNAIHILGNQVCAPVEMPANNRHLDTYNTSITLSDLCFHASAIGEGRAVAEEIL